MPAVTDRFHFLARADQREKTAVRAELVGTTTNGQTATLRLYDPIDSWGDWWGVSAKEFVAALEELPDEITQIDLHINSPGGEVWEALAIGNTLRQYPARIVAIVEGVAASAASFIAVMCDEVVMLPGAQMMIHDALNVCVGNAERMGKMATRLDRESDNIAGLYAAKAGGTAEQWREAMRAETWYFAEEAVDAGLADRVDADAKTAQDRQSQDRFDLSVFAFAGRAKAPAPTAFARRTNSPSGTDGAPAADRSTTEEDSMSKTLTAGLRERLGFAEDADEMTMLAALDEALAETTEQPKTPEASTQVPEAALTEITRLSSEVATLRAEQAERDKAEHFTAWLRDGKTTNAEREALEQMYDAAPAQTIALVSARAKGSAVPVATVGESADSDTHESAALDKAFDGAGLSV